MCTTFQKHLTAQL